jgi:ABC-type antimicrobial peptide transport system permease subunit
VDLTNEYLCGSDAIAALRGVSLTVMLIGFSALVGAFFGIYPPRKASYVDPIEALRYQERHAATR